MKRVLSIIVLIFSLYSCNLGRESRGADGYHISGKVTNCSAKMVLLDQLSTQGFSTIDTAIIDNKGNFLFKGVMKDALFCALRFDANLPAEKRVFIVVDSNTNIKIEADYTSIDNYSVKGSKDCELVKELLNINKKMEDKLRALDTKFAGYDPKNIPDSIGKAVRQEYNMIVKEQETSIEKFVTENNSITIYFAGLFMMQSPPVPLLQKIDEKGMKLYSKSTYAKTIHEFVEKKQHLAIGTLAPELNFKDVNDNNLSLSSLRGQYVLIDFWASWCGPCRRENPNNVALYNKYHSKGFEIYGVSLDDNKAKWKAAIDADKLTWKHVSDLGGWQSEAAHLYDVSSIPQTFLLDKAGKIIAVGLRGEQLTQKLEELFGK